MGDNEIYFAENLEERYELAMGRVALILEEEDVAPPLAGYFQAVAGWILQMKDLREAILAGGLYTMDLSACQALNQALYGDILPEAYETSYANPACCVRLFGGYGQIFSFLYAELRGMIAFAFEGRLFDLTVYVELFIEVYNLFQWEQQPTISQIKELLYSFYSDYAERMTEDRIREQIDSDYDFAARIIMEGDLTDLRYLYRFGEYIGENELAMAAYLNGLSEEKIQAMADAFTEGYRLGFVNGNKDLSIKKIVNIRYHIGFERMIRQAILNFANMGLKPVIYRAPVQSLHRRGQGRAGYVSLSPNRQYDYDHKEDAGIYLDKALVERKLEAARNTYEKYKQIAGYNAGPAVLEVFGEEPFLPETKAEAVKFSQKQQKLSVYYENGLAQIVNRYIRGEERSFTIIAFPVPGIGERFPEIFEGIIGVNALESRLYQSMQQHIIDAFEGAAYVRVTGRGENRTDLRIALCGPENPEGETVFENCGADVNIPVGEVFTTPVLQGTAGLLHVGRVYLDGLEYRDLEVVFEEGMAVSCTCKNFPDERENQAYIRENLLCYHDALPMGEFAIGTNTTAYALARRYGIFDRLPILIAEKTGPHFALGDTCYSHSEEIRVFNPDGKEVVAKDNEVSILRKEDPGRAYFNCHTDITIPWEELGEILAVGADGREVPIIAGGRFVLGGTEVLNEPLERHGWAEGEF